MKLSRNYFEPVAAVILLFSCVAYSEDKTSESTDSKPVAIEAVVPAKESAATKSNKDLSSEDFLKRAQKAPAGESWAKMEGMATHRRTGSKALKDTIRVGIRFTPRRVIAQLVFAGEERYDLGQTFSDPPVFTQDNSVKDMTKSKLAMYGIEPSDLTLGFLYRKFVREEKNDTFKTFPCRVFVLKGDSDKDYVRVWLSTDYCFPMKVHWFSKLPEEKDKPVREMELGGVKKENDFYLISELLLFGADWRTRIEFEKREAALVSAEKKTPVDLFLSEEDLKKNAESVKTDKAEKI